MSDKLSIILPAKNEAENLSALLPKLKSEFPDVEIIVVNDGSDDETPNVAKQNSVTLISHPYTIGNGGAIKTGARSANGDVLIFMDADGQHDPEDVRHLIEQVKAGFDMAVGARRNHSHANSARFIGNFFYNRLASWITGHEIKDLTSGFRAARRDKFCEFLHMLPNGFSYPTTITMAFFKSGYNVSYVSIEAKPRTGKSHIRLIRDGLRFLLIIFRVGTLYSPLKLFLPISLFFLFTGFGYYLFTYFAYGRLTNMSVILFVTSILVFLIGLVSEQITNLLYSQR